MALAPSLRVLATPRALAAPRTTTRSSQGLPASSRRELLCGTVATAACRAYGKRRSKRQDLLAGFMNLCHAQSVFFKNEMESNVDMPYYAFIMFAARKGPRWQNRGIWAGTIWKLLQNEGDMHSRQLGISWHFFFDSVCEHLTFGRLQAMLARKDFLMF